VWGKMRADVLIYTSNMNAKFNHISAPPAIIFASVTLAEA